MGITSGTINLDDLKSFTKIILDRYPGSITEEEVRTITQQAINLACMMSQITFEEFAKENKERIEAIKKFIREQKTVKIKEALMLNNQEGVSMEARFKKYEKIKEKTIWKHWEAYLSYLKIDKKRPPAVVSNLDSVTDNILCHLPNPQEVAKFSISGLVVGFVQSGKTENYSGLINKAIDLKYDFIIILAGVPSILRNQTQYRIDTDVMGVNSLTNQEVGIGKHMDGNPDIEVYTKQDKLIKSRTRNGDFSANKSRDAVGYLGKKQLIFVVKKNKDVLTALKEYLQNAAGVGIEDGKNYLAGKSLLLIDDEADHASINNNTVEEASKVFSEINEITELFDKKMLVGYTATPFANIFLNPEEPRNTFPKDFIFLLEPPNDYLGPFEFFGINHEGTKIEKMPLVVETDELDSVYFKDGETVKDWDYTEYGVNPSMEEAICSFTLSGAIRNLRGQRQQHHSMLIHISTYQASHNDVQQAVQAYIDELKNCGEVGECEVFWAKVKDLWRGNFLSTSKEMERLDTELMEASMPIEYDMNFEWEEVEREVISFLGELQEVHKINGEKDSDSLDYKKYKDENDAGMKVICVGGSVLGRGFTVEGLSCSYYARNSLQLDTVLQCGRFFGYHPNYRDLVRVYTTQENEKILALAAHAIYELTVQFKQMIDDKKSPKDFGLYVTDMFDTILEEEERDASDDVDRKRKSKKRKSKLSPTAIKRMRSFEPVSSSFSGYELDVASFKLDDEVAQHNLDVVNRFITELGEETMINDAGLSQKDNKAYTWPKVDSLKTMELLSNLKISKYSRFREVGLLKDYVSEVREKHDDLFSFDIALARLPENSEAGPEFGGGRKFVNLASRLGDFPQTKADGEDTDYWKVSLGRALTGRHITFGLTPSEKKQLPKLDDPSGVHKPKDVSKIRKGRGLLIIYVFSTKSANEALEAMGRPGITKPPIGLYISLPECVHYENRKTIANIVYHMNHVLGGNIV